MDPLIGLKESGLVISVTMKLIKDPAGIVVAKFLLGCSDPCSSSNSSSLLLTEIEMLNVTSYLSPESVQSISPSSQNEVP